MVLQHTPVVYSDDGGMGVTVAPAESVDEAVVLAFRSVKPYFSSICSKSFLYDSKSSSRTPRMRFRNLMKTDPCSGFVIKSAIISPVGQYSTLTSLCLIRSVIKK